MCGIAGHVRFGNEPQAGTLTPVLARLAHRGPDNTAEEQFGPALLGHTRLSILDLSEAGNQPMVCPVTGNAVVLNGEIYNFQELKELPELRDYPFRSTSDTEVLLAMYAVFGEDCLAHLRGMYAFAIWNPSKKQLFFARDRMGVKPFVYSAGPKGLIFASEVRALAAHPDVSREIDPFALDLYLSNGSVPAPFAAYVGMNKLPPAHCGTYDKNGLTIRQYWQLDYRTDVAMDEQEALEHLEELLFEAVRLRMISDVPLGALLSGGVDSSLVVACMARQSSEQVRTFSIGFGEEKYNELPYAKQVAEVLGVSHEYEILPPTSLGTVAETVAQFGEPFSDDSSIAALQLCRMTRKHVTVALGGDGGDELACGYSSYTHARTASLLHRVLPVSNLSEEQLIRLSKAGSLTRKLQFGYLHPESKRLLRNEARLHGLKEQTYTTQMRSQCGEQTRRWLASNIAKAPEHAHSPVERLLWMDNRLSLPDMLLVKMDIAAMAHSLEVRSPFLDHKLIEFMATLPVSLKLKNNEPKYLLKKLAEKHLPKELLYRRKQGFSMPVSSWLATPEGKALLLETFASADGSIGQWFRMDVLAGMVDDHAAGKGRHGKFLWNMLNLAAWAGQA